jgi:preprotein translocase subunit SecA
MFSPGLIKNTHAMRPGLISGKYPEKIDEEPSRIDRLNCRIKGLLVPRPACFETSLDKIARDIGSGEAELTRLKTTDLNTLVLKLRRQLHRQGLTPRLCIQSFALIRETALRTLKLRHYDSQLMAGWVMLQGQVAEMETGEGKTLAATLTAATLGLAGIPVHIITANEYLVERDARTMAPLYKALGLSSGFITQEMTTEQRQAGYACDILHCTNKLIVFDYLRDRLVMGKNQSPLRRQLSSAYTGEILSNPFLLRGLSFAILDEADSLLIDEAITPLILTQNIDDTTRTTLYQKILDLARSLDKNRDFFMDPGRSMVQLSWAGQKKLTDPLISKTGPGLGRRQGEEMVVQALHALHLLHRDQDYLVQDKKIHIIDANTGRAMPDRSWEHGLHQFVETKEDCPLTQAKKQLGRLTFQRFFGRYLGLAGMTGTAREVHSELWTVYGLKVRKIPLNRPGRRREVPGRIYPGQKEKWAAVIAQVNRLKHQDRPVLIGTGSLADSEILSRKLTRANITHQVLNARQDKKEAAIVARAGQKGQITVATNMAGRGTDIPLGHGVASLGGLHVIGTCCNQAKRIDRQLFGRCARQGDPGSFQAILCLDDERVVQNCPTRVHRLLIRATTTAPRAVNRLNRHIIRRAQKKRERQDCRARKALLKHDRQTARLLGFSGHME